MGCGASSCNHHLFVPCLCFFLTLIHAAAALRPQIVLIPIPNSKTSEEVLAAMMSKVDELKQQLEEAGVRVTTDCRTNYTPG